MSTKRCKGCGYRIRGTQASHESGTHHKTQRPENRHKTSKAIVNIQRGASGRSVTFDTMTGSGRKRRGH